MIEGLKPYAEYKESGQEWLGRVPAHWDVRRTKLILREVDSRSTTGKEQLLRVSQYTGVTQRKAADGSDAPDTRAASLVGYKRVSVNDLVINIMLAWNGSMGVSRFNGIASPAYCVYRLNKGAQPWYFHQLFRLPLYKGRIKAVSTGVIESRLRLYSDDLGRIEAILPPPGEQAAIVRFLDHANRKIDGFIRAKRKLIGLLNEQKQAIIHRAVTRGLHPDAPLKPSGIPWLGDIPKHWGIVRNMALFAHRVEPGIAGLPVLQVSLRSGITAEELDQFGRPKRLIADATKYKRIHQGDMAYNTMRMWQGAVGVSPSAGLVSPAYVVLKPRKDTCPEFYDFIFHTEVYKQQVNRQSTGIVSDRNRLYWDSFKQMPNLTLPPTEQEEIVTFIAKATAPLNTAIARTEREITLMQEYRTRLTADLVTGKLDVREAAAKLPEEDDEPADDALDEAEVLYEIEPEES
jgi:type I restriction enzyme S subunit